MYVSLKNSSNTVWNWELYCLVAQLSSLAVTLAVRIASPDAFAQIQLDTAHQEKQRDYFLLIVVIPYFVCFLLSFLCALYVVKALLAQTRRDKQVKSKVNQWLENLQIRHLKNKGCIRYSRIWLLTFLCQFDLTTFLIKNQQFHN